MCLSASIARIQRVPFVRATTKPFITHSSRAFHMCLIYNLPHWSCWVLASWQLHYLSGNGTAPHSQAIFYTVFWIHKQSLEADVLPLESWGCSSGLMFFPSMYQHNIHIHMCLLGLWCQEFCWLLLTRFVGSSLTPSLVSPSFPASAANFSVSHKQNLPSPLTQIVWHIVGEDWEEGGQSCCLFLTWSHTGWKGCRAIKVQFPPIVPAVVPRGISLSWFLFNSLTKDFSGPVSLPPSLHPTSVVAYISHRQTSQVQLHHTERTVTPASFTSASPTRLVVCR